MTFGGNEELSAIAWLWRNPVYLARYQADLTPECFDYTPARALFEMLSAVWSETRAVPTLDEAIVLIRRNASAQDVSVPVVDRTVDDLRWVVEAEHSPASQEILRRIVAESTVRSLVDELGEASGEAILSRVSEVRRRLEALERRPRTMDIGTLPFSRAILVDPIAGLERAYGGRPVPMGIKRLDEAFQGGIYYGELGCVMAPFGVGKSMLMLNFAFSAYLLGLRVVYYALDNLDPEMRKRVWARAVEDSIEKERESTRYGEQIRDAVEGYDDFGRFIIKTLPPRRAAVVDLEEHLDAVREEYSVIDQGRGLPKERWGAVDLVIIDTPDKMVVREKVDSNRFRIEIIYQDIIAMLEERKIAGWVTSQTNRQGWGRAIQWDTNVSEAAQKMAESSHVIGLGRSTIDRRTGHGTIHVLKARRSRVTHRVFPLIMNDVTGVVTDNRDAPVEWVRDTRGDGTSDSTAASGGPGNGPVQDKSIANRLKDARSVG